MYIGVNTEVPIYEESVGTVAITADNISTYFAVQNDTYYFAGSGNIFTSNNSGVNSTTAKTTLVALQDISNITFTYYYSTEKSYDKFTLVVGDTTVENAVSGVSSNKSYTGSLLKGQSVVFTFSKDNGTAGGTDDCAFFDMSITCNIKTQIGTEIREVAQKAEGCYIGVNNVAKKIKKAYIGVNGIARLVYEEAKTGRFVCVGANGKSYYSEDGETWTAMTGLASTENRCVAYGSGLFVTINVAKKTYCSTDGLTWVETSGIATNKIYGATYGNGRFVAVGISGTSYYSLDGMNWTAMSGLSSNDFNGVTYGNGRFVCVGASGKSYYSTNGTSWTAMSGLASTNYYGVTYGDGRFVCAGASGKSYYSTNGTSWTAMTGLAGYTYNGVAYGNGVFVAVPSSGKAYYSTNGTAWTAGATSLGTCFGVTYGNDRFVAVGETGKSFFSTDGINWTAMTGLASNEYRGVCYGEKQKLKPFEFTSNIIPVFTSATKLDQYGIWEVTHSSDNGSDVKGWYGFDMDSGTWWQSGALRETTSTAWVQLDCPIKILPYTIYLSQRMIASGKIQGYNDSTGEWEDLADITSSSSWRSDTYTVTTQKYYSSFRVYGVRYSSTYNTAYVRDFEIRTGKAKP